jgi:uncharacterized repeat protein (TIGR01451 family)
MAWNWLFYRAAHPKFARRQTTRRKRTSCRLTLESLEERAVPAVSVLNNSGSGYAALSFNQSGGYVPPDTVGAAGPSGYLETVNQSVALYTNKSTGAGAVTDSLAHFLFTTGGLTRADSGSGLSDPINTYDEQIGRFIVGDQDVDFNTHVSAFDLAVSRTSNPTTLSASDWAFYKIVTTESGYDADYPGNFGYNHDALVFSLNMFGVSGGGHAQLVAVNATDLMNAATSPQIAHNDLNDFSVRPTVMHDSVAGDPMWLVTEHGDNQSIDVIKMTGELTTSAAFTYTNLAVTPYSQVVYPRNPNGTVITNNIDSRIMKAAEANNTIVATHAVAVSSTQDVAQWYAIDVSSGTPVLQQQGRVGAGANTYITYPGIDINASGQIGMSYMRSGTDTSTDYLSMWVTGRTASDAAGSMETPVLVPAGTGQANYKDFTSGGRAGDLSGINVDPGNGTFWAANEFANTEATANWGTAVANFAPSAPTNSADMAVTASGPSTVTAGTTVTYTITLTNNGPSAAAGVVLTDTLPAGSTFVSLTQTGGTDSFTLAQSGGSATETANANLAAGSSDTFALAVSAPSTLAPGANFSDTASVGSSTSDPNTANNSATVSGSVVGPPADLAVSETGPTTANEGATLTYTVTVTNNGPNAATGTVLTDTLGANLRFVSATTSQGTFTQSGGVVTFSIGNLSYPGSMTATVTAQALEDGNLSNSAAVTTTAADPNSANNSTSASTAVAEPAIVVTPVLTTTTSKSLSNVTVATFTHASGVEPTSAFRATINWGDGKTSTGTITQSGTTYSVIGSHNYKKSGSHTITTTVTEVGSATQLLLAKMGDEVPGLPDHVGGDDEDGGGSAANGPPGGFRPSSTAPGQGVGGQPAPRGGSNSTPGGVAGQVSGGVIGQVFFAGNDFASVAPPGQGEASAGSTVADRGLADESGLVDWGAAAGSVPGAAAKFSGLPWHQDKDRLDLSVL